MSAAIMMTVISVLVVALMTWDQLSRRQMTPFKWALVPLIVAISSLGAWLNLLNP